MSEKTLDVLVVEHDAMIRMLTHISLSSTFPSCRVDLASDTEEALRLVRNKPPYRLVILEPYGLTRHLTEPKRLIETVKGHQTEEIKTSIVIVSTLSLDQLRRDYGISEDDFDLYIGKPVGVELTDGVSGYLGDPAP
ncbi:hypothetical protein HYU10_01485 [Candidatus Woesearchaeota archaeon]|nr:hypothetical protein [Candidatus Woesearchaeota archaeon]MBI2130419.1 hypothetical protein [Candidatus Woesearchaeota archaeon]MBI2660757.1 hypothetical protein [Candidatus Woesearchaeota archaeon]